jgi:integrase
MERLFTSVDEFCSPDSPKTAKAYRKALTLFAVSKYGDSADKDVFPMLDEYIRKATLQDALDDLRRFKKFLDNRKITKYIDGKAISTGYALASKLLAIAAVQSWYGQNGLRLPKEYNKKLGYKEKPDFEDLAFNPTTAKAVFDTLTTPVSKCLFVFLLSTGCRINEATQVRIPTITWDYKMPDGSKGPVRIKLEGKYTKNGKPRIVFLTEEAETLIRDLWIDKQHTRTMYNTKIGKKFKEEATGNGRYWYLRAARNKNKGLVDGGRGAVRPENDDRLFPFSISVARKMLMTPIRRAGFTERTETGINKLHVHSTRKFFRTWFGKAAGADAAETILGHSPGLTANYRLLPEAEIAAEFKKHQRAITIIRDPEAEKLREHAELVGDRQLALERENAKLRDRVADDSARLALLETTMKKIVENLQNGTK